MKTARITHAVKSRFELSATTKTGLRLRSGLGSAGARTQKGKGDAGRARETTVSSASNYEYGNWIREIVCFDRPFSV